MLSNSLFAVLLLGVVSFVHSSKVFIEGNPHMEDIDALNKSKTLSAESNLTQDILSRGRFFTSRDTGIHTIQTWYGFGNLRFGMLVFGALLLHLFVLYPAFSSKPSLNKMPVDMKKCVITFKDAEPHYVDDAIYFLMDTHWSATFVILFDAYVLIAAIFAVLLMFGGSDTTVSGAGSHDFITCFHFSIETLCTVGYGKFLPTSPYAHTIVVLETYVGLTMAALGGGILFSRVSRPQSRVEFSEVMTVNNNDEGLLELTLRMMNHRQNAWLDSHVSFNVLIRTSDGGRMLELKLARDHFPVMRGGWLLTHRIDDLSPLCGLMTDREVDERVVGFLAFMKGTDSTFFTHICETKYYPPDTLSFGQKFVSMMDFSGENFSMTSHLLSITEDVQPVQVQATRDDGVSESGSKMCDK